MRPSCYGDVTVRNVTPVSLKDELEESTEVKGFGEQCQEKPTHDTQIFAVWISLPSGSPACLSHSLKFVLRCT